jgi:hypothetical protein
VSGISLIPDTAKLRLRITVTPVDAANPLIVEEADCGDIFGVMHELEHITGPRLRRRLHEAAAANLLRLNPITGEINEP